LFRYAIYIVKERGVESFDPGTDLLISPDTYLVWRHVKQAVPGAVNARLYAGATHKDGGWQIMSIDSKIEWLQVENWLEDQRQRAAGQNLGMHERRYRGLLFPLSREFTNVDYESRIKSINIYLGQFHLGEEPWQAGDPQYTVNLVWKDVKERLIKLILERNKQLQTV
jgi:hypothetical protein